MCLATPFLIVVLGTETSAFHLLLFIKIHSFERIVFLVLTPLTLLLLLVLVISLLSLLSRSFGAARGSIEVICSAILCIVLALFATSLLFAILTLAKARVKIVKVVFGLEVSVKVIVLLVGATAPRAVAASKGLRLLAAIS